MSSKKKSSLRAFSLIETVIVLFLAGLVLGAVSLLTRETLSTLRFLEEKGRTVQSATLGCERLCSELRETITTPSVTAGSSVSFSKVVPSSDKAVGNAQSVPPPPVLPSSYLWTRTYNTAANRVLVTYQTDAGNRLNRTAGGEPARVVATDVNSIRVTPGGAPGNYTVALTLQENRRLITFTSFVHCPGAPRP